MIEQYANAFGWASALLPLGAAFAAAYFGASRWTIALAIVIAFVASTAHVLRSSVVADLKSELAQLSLNRWEPLSAIETKALRAKLKEIAPPHQTIHVLCAMAGCGDLAISIRNALQIPGWKVALVPVVVSDDTAGIEFWHHDEASLRIAGAIADATDGRLTMRLRRFERADDAGQINIAIGRKP